MPDREKVIYDIERCICHVPDACRDCSHYGRGEVIGCMEELLTDALALLKEHESVVPGLGQDADGIYSTCGNCKARLWKMFGVEFVFNHDAMPKFCPQCGKEVKWE